MKHIIYILLFLVSFNGIAQNFSDEQKHQIDSLNEVIAKTNGHDTTVALTYLEIANYYYLQNPDTAIILCQVTERISEQINYGCFCLSKSQARK